MGTYLSTPVTEKCVESDDDLDGRPFPLSWAVVDMQGWRKTMEDAHIARTRVPLQNDDDNPAESVSAQGTAKVFAIFDGHGGAEVARFCQLYLVSVLTQQSAWLRAVQKLLQSSEGNEEDSQEVNLSPKDTDMGRALIDTFHALDRMIDDPSRREELLRLRSLKPSSQTILDASAGNHETDTTACEEASETTTSAVEEPSSEEPVNGPSETSAGENDDDSVEATGHEEAAEVDRDMMLDDGPSEPGHASDELSTTDTQAGPVLVGPAAPETMTELIQRFLNLNPSNDSGQVVLQLGQDSDSPKGESSGTDDVTSPPFNASIIRNGRPICNLPNHPVHAGATAVVTVIFGNQLTVANAGDSRAILCRCGSAYPLTSDHKPLQEREMARIRNAGGFVNHFGRVNGNLNLSRSIGDLKYKQVPGLTPAEQMITAEPDIVQVALGPDDEFLVLGCDGIFDCLSNEQCIEFVRSRINEKNPTEIGVEMLNEIISDDPRASQGIGGDNMTIMIVDLQPLSRPYRQSNL